MSCSERKKSRFALYTEEIKIKQELEEEEKVNAKATVANTTFGLNTYRSFCVESGISDEVSLETLPNILKKFYMCARTESGELYKLNSMRSLRSALRRHYLSLYNIDIVHDTKFVEANAVFTNILKKLKEAGKGETEHHTGIDPEDLAKLFESFDIDHPIGLQEIVWFNLLSVFIRRGRQNIRQMTKDTFAIATDDESGTRFIYQVDGELDKNHSINDSVHDSSSEGRLYETGGEKCPVRLFEFYLSKLNPGNISLWQRPKDLKSYVGQDVWYRNVSHGENNLGNMMGDMSVKYNLSQRYTNHCLRVTSLQKLDDSRMDGRHTSPRVSGHKNEHSMKQNARKLSAETKRKISGILSEYQGSSSSTTVNISDKQLAELPPNILQNTESSLNVCGTMNFAPVLNSCSNITFNIHVNKTD